MITWYGSFSTSVAEVFRDHERADLFYVLPHRPRIGIDHATGKPIFYYHLVARDTQLAFASGSTEHPPQYQIGLLGMHVDLSLTPEEHEIVRAACAEQMQQQAPKARGYYRLFQPRAAASEPLLSAINTWTEGSVRIDLVMPEGPTFKTSSSSEYKPALYGTNGASMSATFGAEGAQLMFESLGGRRPGEEPATSLTGLPIVVYSLKFAARSPALTVSVVAHGQNVYRELRDRMTVQERTGRGTWTYPQISELTRSLCASRAIEVKWEDGGMPAVAQADDELRKELESSVLSLVTGKIIETFFSEFQFQGLKEGDLGQDPFLHSQAGSGKPGNVLWLKEFKEEFISDMSFTLTRSQNTIIPKNPNVVLSAVLTPEQIREQVKLIDVGNPEVEVLQVPIYTNADFAGDKIANITVDIKYDQPDALLGGRRIQERQTYVFRTGNEAFTFVTRLARDSEGRLIDKYDVTARVTYIGVGQSPPPIEIKGVSERALTISYDRLGYVKVDVQAGDIDWKEIEKVFVDLEYAGAAGQPDARKQVTLTQNAPVASWTSAKRGSSTNGYNYTVTYKMLDTTQQTTKTKSDERGTLVVHDLLVGRLRHTFDAVLDAATVKTLLLRVRYTDEANEVHVARNTFTATGYWEYSRPLREGAPRDVEYSAVLQYSDNMVEELPWVKLGFEQEAPTLKARRYKYSVVVDGTLLDPKRWSAAYVTLEYEDPGHDYFLTTPGALLVTEQAPLQRFEVLAFSPQARSYRYQVTFVPVDPSAEPVQVPPGGDWGTSTQPQLLLHRLVK